MKQSKKQYSIVQNYILSVNTSISPFDDSVSAEILYNDFNINSSNIINGNLITYSIFVRKLNKVANDTTLVTRHDTKYNEKGERIILYLIIPHITKDLSQTLIRNHTIDSQSTVAQSNNTQIETVKDNLICHSDITLSQRRNNIPIASPIQQALGIATSPYHNFDLRPAIVPKTSQLGCNAFDLEFILLTRMDVLASNPCVLPA